MRRVRWRESDSASLRMLDHLIYAVPDLDAAMAEVAERLGGAACEPAPSAPWPSPSRNYSNADSQQAFPDLGVSHRWCGPTQVSGLGCLIIPRPHRKGSYAMLLRSIVLALVIAALAMLAGDGAELPVAAALVAAAALALGGGAAWYARRRWAR